MYSQPIYKNSTPNHFESKDNYKSCTSKYAIVTCAVGGVAGAVIAALGGIALFGSIGSYGFIASITVGGVLVSSAVSGIVWMAIANCKKHNQAILSKENNATHLAKKDDSIDVNTISLNAFESADIEEVQSYLGKRRELWLACKAGQKPYKLLDIHTVLLREIADDKGFLWRATLNGHTVNLYGTVHNKMLSPEDTFPYTFDYKGKIDDEYDKAYDAWLKKIYEKAQQILPPAVFEAFNASHDNLYFETNNDDRVAFQKARKAKTGKDFPVMTHKVASNKKVASVRLFHHGSEWLLETAAKYENIWGRSLEDEDWLARVLPALERAFQKEPEYAKIKDEISLQIYDAWHANNWEQLQEIFKCQPKSVQDATNGDGNKRNLNFAKKIRKLLKKPQTSTPFIAIGAMHFTGSDGILELLKKEGVSLEFINL